MKPLHIDDDYELIKADLHALLGPKLPEKGLVWFGGELRRRRLDAGKTQIQVAKAAGINQPAVSDAERDGLQEIGNDLAERLKGDTSLLPRMKAETLYVLARAVGAELEEIALLPARTDTDISPAQIAHLLPQLLEVNRIVTLIRPGVPTYVTDIYHRTLVSNSMVWRGKSEEAFEVDTLADLPHSASVILGRAGQGKSILMRHLVIQESLKKEALPLFFELRDLETGTLRELLLKKLRIWNLIEYPKELDVLLTNGRLSLLFDAFDELAVERRKSFLKELSDLHAEYPGLKIVVSARPDTGIVQGTFLRPYYIWPLQSDDVKSLIRIYSENEFSDDLVDRIKGVNIKVGELLEAPIFVVLLVIKFEYSNEIPSSLVAFYADLFDALLRRHNKYLGIFKREISSDLGPTQLQALFGAMCVRIHERFGDRPIHISAVENIARECSEICLLSPKMPARIVDDIIRITNLIIEEGGMCYFVHRSVREYYAAACVCECDTDVDADAWYSEIRRRWWNWRGVLWFLEQLDRVRYLRLFAIPDLSRFAPFTPSKLVNVFSNFKLLKHDDKKFMMLCEIDAQSCYEITRGLNDALVIPGSYSELRELIGRKETRRVLKVFERSGEFSFRRWEFVQRCNKCLIDTSPLTNRFGSERKIEFERLLKEWEQEVHAARLAETDSETG